ncbi:MAG TPA: alginate export family protein [Burkholderiales bacterium]
MMPVAPVRRAFIVAAFIAAPLDATLAQSEDACPARPDYRNLRYEENWRSLADPTCTDGLFDRLKYLPLGETGTNYVSFGGEGRFRYEYVENGAFGADVEDANGYFLKRALLHADFHSGERFRAFVQLQSANEAGRVGGPRIEDEDDIDFNQAFADLTAWSNGEDSLTVRAGRQELEFGASRLLSARDGMNTRQSFDGFRAFGRWGRWHYNATGARIVNTLPGAFDNDTKQGNWYLGASAWTAFDPLPGSTIAVINPSRRQENTEFDAGIGVDERYTHGVRLWGKTGDWDYNWETGIQRGEFEGMRVRAWYFASDTGYSFDGPGAPRFGVRFDATSGDRNAGDGELNTFSALFASTAYSGLAGQIGPSNAIDLAPSLSFSPVPNVRINAGVIGFWRTSLEDGIYKTTGGVRRTGQSSDARHVGTQTTLQAVYTPTPRWTLLATFAYFDAGRFLEETPPGEDVTYFTTWVTFRF